MEEISVRSSFVLVSKTSMASSFTNGAASFRNWSLSQPRLSLSLRSLSWKSGLFLLLRSRSEAAASSTAPSNSDLAHAAVSCASANPQFAINPAHRAAASHSRPDRPPLAPKPCLLHPIGTSYRRDAREARRAHLIGEG